MSSEINNVQKLLQNNSLRQILEKFENLAYFFVGKTGTICEFWSDKVDRDTRFELMKSRLENVNTLLTILK